jgi:hypothetical protein
MNRLESEIPSVEVLLLAEIEGQLSDDPVEPPSELRAEEFGEKSAVCQRRC